MIIGQIIQSYFFKRGSFNLRNSLGKVLLQAENKVLNDKFIMGSSDVQSAC